MGDSAFQPPVSWVLHVGGELLPNKASRTKIIYRRLYHTPQGNKYPHNHGINLFKSN